MVDCEKYIWKFFVRVQKEIDCIFKLDFDGSLIKGLIIKSGQNLGNLKS